MKTPGPITRTSAALAAGVFFFCAVSGACARNSAPLANRAHRTGTQKLDKIAFADPGAVTTSRDQLARTIDAMTARLKARPDDSASAVTLADALMRQARVTGNAGLARRAEAALDAVLAAKADDYPALRMRAAVYLSGHRFREALQEAERARAIQPNDAWNYGAIGDAHLELGEYPEAFAAFDRMAEIKPNAASYARVSYARELQGDLDAAVRFMRMAAEATSPQDSESVAWHYAQIGHLELERGRLGDAAIAYEHAAYVFPRHPLALEGLALVKAQQGDAAGALETIRSRSADATTPSDLAIEGDLLTSLGRLDEADRSYRLAEAAWQSDTPEPARLARFLADHKRRPADAVAIAEGAAKVRQDIFTMDALAWAYFQAGRVPDARVAIKSALRTGSRDTRIRLHARAIGQDARP